MPTTFANTINGNEILAKRAECDYAGNDIQTTYATKVEVSTKQDVISDLATIRSGAAAGSTAVQPGDLASVATSGDYDDLNNKPSIPTATSDLTNDSGFITAADIPAQVNADWNSNSGASEILNKPDLGVYATTQAMNTALAGKQDTISDLSSIRSGASAGATAVQPGDLATVATTGSYDDLSDKPSIPAAQVNSDWNASSGVAAILNKPTLSAVATTGDYDDLTDKPDLSAYATTQAMNTALAAKQDTISDLSTIRSGASAGSTAVQPGDLAAVATTGSYNDLSDKPSIPAAQVNSDWNASSGVAEILNKPTLATVATSGSYNDLSNKPDLSVYAESADLATVATTGAYSDLTGTPTIPTATSDLTNDSGFITSADLPTIDQTYDATSANAQSGTAVAGAVATKQDVISDLATIRSGAQAGSTAVQPGDLATVATTGAYSDLTGTPAIPTATSDLTNDSGFITLSDVPAQVNADWNSSSGASEILNKPTLATVATTGAYSDLSGKPTVDQTYDAASSNAQSGTAVAQAISSVDAVPDVTSSDNGKVLVATYSGGAGSYAWASTPPANAIILDYSSTWSDFHTPYSAGRKDIYYKHTTPYAPFESRAELYLHLTAVSDVDGSSTNFTYALFEGAWQSAGVDYTVRCQFRYSGKPSLHVNALTVEQSYSSSSTRAQSGVAVAQAISAVNQVPSSTSADADKVLTVDAQGTPAWATVQAPISAGNGIDITDDVVSVDTSVVATQTDLAGKQDTISDLATIRSGAAAGATAVQPGDLATVATTGAYSDLTGTPTIPTATSDLTNDSGFITLSDVPAQVNADWNSSSGASEILNKPTIPSGTQLVPAATSADADKVLTVDAQGTPAWATASGSSYSAGTGIDITNNVVSVDTSVVATQTDLADKEDAFDVGTGLEMDTSGATPTLQVEAPVDIVAGPGIVIDNPDGNTLRVSQAYPTDETVLWEQSSYSYGLTSVTLTESYKNFETIKVYTNKGDVVMMHPDNSQLVNTCSLTHFNASNIWSIPWSFTDNTHYEGAAGVMLYNDSGTMKAVTVDSSAPYGRWEQPEKIVGIHRIAGGN